MKYAIGIRQLLFSLIFITKWKLCYHETSASVTAVYHFKFMCATSEVCITVFELLF